MQSCCLEDCESYKCSAKQKIAYFKFPLDNKPLLKKWISQIKKPKWYPTEADQICSTHFHVNDIDYSHKYPKLRDTAMPMIFPLKYFQNIPMIEKKVYTPKQTTKNIVHSNQIAYIVNIDDLNSTKNVSHNSEKLSTGHTIPKLQNNVFETKLNNSSNLLEKNIVSDLHTSNLTSLNPYILIVSDEKYSKVQTKTSSTKQSHAVLKIQIEKKVNTNQNSINSFVYPNKCNQLFDNQRSLNNYIEEVAVEDVLSSKVVIFKFDASTGKITVVKKEKNNEVSKEKLVAKTSISTNNHESSYDNSKAVHSNKFVNDRHPTTDSNQNLTTESKLNTCSKKVKNVAKRSRPFTTQINGSSKSQQEKSIDNSEKPLQNNHLDPDLCVLTSNVIQKRKLDVITITNTSEDECEPKDPKSIKKEY